MRSLLVVNPITWQNVQSRSSAGAAALFKGAREGITEGLSTLTGVLDRERAQTITNQERDVEEGTQSFLDKIASFKTPESLQGAIDSGELAQFQTTLGENIDPARARNAATDKLASLRQQTTVGQDFEKSQAQRELAPLVQKIRRDIAAGKVDSAVGILDTEAKALAESGQLATLQNELHAKRRSLLIEKDVDITRKERKEEKASEIDKSNLITNAVNTSQSLTEARVRARAGADKLSSTDQMSLMADLDEFYMGENDLTPAAFNRVQQVEEAAGRIAAAEARKATTTLANAESAYKATARYPYDPDSRKTIGDVHETLNGLGWDPSTAAERTNAVRKDFIEQQAKDGDPMSKTDKAALDTVLNVAAASLGTPGDNFYDNDDLRRDDLYGALEIQWDEYKLSEGNRIELLKARDVYNEELTRIDADLSDAATGALQQERLYATGIKKLFEAQSK